MISFELAEDQAIAQRMVREAARNAFRPKARACDEARAIPDDVLNELWSLGIVQALADGSAPADPVLNVLVLEELGWADASFALALSGALGFVRAVADQGSERQRRTLLPLFAGAKFAAAAIALVEPSFEFDVTDLKTTATPTKKGVLINGVKAFIPLADKCIQFLVITQGADGQDAYIVPKDAPGVTVSSPDLGLGLNGLQMARVTFKDVAVDASQRLGEGAGSDVQRIIDSARIGAAAVLTGLCGAVFDYVSNYTKERVAHGSAVARKQSVAFRLVDMHIAIESARWMTWKAASLQGKQSGTSTREARLLQDYANEQAMWISDEGLQLLGGHGFLRDHPVEMWYRNARALTVLEGVAGV